MFQPSTLQNHFKFSLFPMRHAQHNTLPTKLFPLFSSLKKIPRIHFSLCPHVPSPYPITQILKSQRLWHGDWRGFRWSRACREGERREIEREMVLRGNGERWGMRDWESEVREGDEGLREGVERETRGTKDKEREGGERGEGRWMMD